MIIRTYFQRKESQIPTISPLSSGKVFSLPTISSIFPGLTCVEAKWVILKLLLLASYSHFTLSWEKKNENSTNHRLNKVIVDVSMNKFHVLFLAYSGWEYPDNIKYLYNTSNAKTF